MLSPVIDSFERLADRSDHATLQIAALADLGDLLVGGTLPHNMAVAAACEALKTLKTCEFGFHSQKGCAFLNILVGRVGMAGESFHLLLVNGEEIERHSERVCKISMIS